MLDPKEKKGPNIAETKQAILKHIVQKTGKPVLGTSVPKGSPWVWAMETYEATPKQDPKLLYGWVGEHLVVADKRYLASKQVEERRKGLGLVCEACNCAAHRLKDTKLAVQICETYVLPNIDAADERHWKYLGKQNILEVAVGAYAEAKDADNMAEMLKLCIENAHNRNTADGARLRLARVLERQEKYEEALKYLKEIDPNEGVGGGRLLIPDIEKKLKAKK
ncbi:MAG: tetratricopeptide repeat protein [Gemmataceae bacterium]|nr:tetratricopeptide repeat protein [Gemmataceae bacterium]